LFYPGLRFAWDLVGLVLVLGGGGWCHVAKNDGFGGGRALGGKNRPGVVLLVLFRKIRIASVKVTTVKVFFFFEIGVINCAFTFAMSYFKVLVELVATRDEQFTVGLVS